MLQKEKILILHKSSDFTLADWGAGTLTGGNKSNQQMGKRRMGEVFP